MNRLPVAVGLAAAALALGWQGLTVHYNYGGNWTALFCTGGELKAPPQLASENIYRFQGSTGYDGQFYHYEAHDPFLRRGLAAYMDAPRLRYRRILVPVAAYLLAAGQDGFVDAAFIGVILLSVFLGAWWLSMFAELSGRHAAWGLGFLLLPATLISIDRLVIDVTLAALVGGFAYYARQGPSWKLYLVLVCSVLARETGVFLIAAYCLYLLYVRRPGKAAWFATSVGPALAWCAYIQPSKQGDLVRNFLTTPDDWRQLVPLAYPLPATQAAVLVGLDYLAMAGIILAMVLATRRGFRRPVMPDTVAALGCTVLAVWTFVIVPPGDPYTFPRVISPLLFLVALSGSRAGLAPVALVSARIAAQLGPQVLGVLRGLL